MQVFGLYMAYDDFILIDDEIRRAALHALGFVQGGRVFIKAREKELDCRTIGMLRSCSSCMNGLNLGHEFADK